MAVAMRKAYTSMRSQREQMQQVTRVEECPDAGQAVSFRASRRPIRQFGCRHTVNHQSAFAAARSDRTENRRQTCGNLANPEKTPGHPDNCTIPYNIDASPQRRGINREPLAPASRRMNPDSPDEMAFGQLCGP